MTAGCFLTLVILEEIHNQDVPPHPQKTCQRMHWSRVLDYCCTWRGWTPAIKNGILAAGEFDLFHSRLLSLLERDEDGVKYSVTQPFEFELSQSPQIDLIFHQNTIIWLGCKVFTCPFFCQSLDFLTSPKVQSKRESRRLKLSIVSLKCAARLSVVPWSHLLLTRSICCASEAIWYAGFVNLLRSDNLASMIFVTVLFSLLLAIAKWWMHCKMWNKVSTACAKFRSSKGPSESPELSIWTTFFACPWCYMYQILWCTMRTPLESSCKSVTDIARIVQ